MSLDIFRWGRGLPHEGVGAKKFGMPLETREIKLFWRDIPGFRPDIPGVPEKFDKKKFGFNFVPYSGQKLPPREALPSKNLLRTLLRLACQDFRFLPQDPPTPEGFQKGFRRGL